MFGIFCIMNGVFVFFFIKETKGKTLEEMDILFGTVDASQREADLERTFAEEKGMVQHEEHHADKAVEAAK